MNFMHLPSETLNYKDLIAVYCNIQSPDKFLVGKVQISDADYLVLSLLSPDSQEDGLCLCSADFIFRIEKDSQYLLSLNTDICSASTPYLYGNAWDAFLSYAEEHKLVMQVKGYSGKRIMFGIPVDHSNDIVTVHRICSDGTKNRFFRINRKKIAMLVCDSSDEQEMNATLKNRSGFNA